MAAFELATFRFLEDFVRRHNIPCDWTPLTGVHTFLTQDVFDIATAAVKNLEKRYPDLAAAVELVRPSGSGSRGSGETLASLRVPNAKGAVMQTNAAALWPYKLVSWVLEQLLDQFPEDRFNLQTNTPVTKLQRLGPDSSMGNQDRRGWVLTTPRGRITAPTVILCTNGYTSRLLPAFTELIVPTRGQVATLLPPNNEGEKEDQDPVMLGHSYVFVGTKNESVPDRSEYLIQRPLPGGELIFGGGRQCAKGLGIGEWHDDVVEEAVSRWLRGQLSPPLDLSRGNSTTNSMEQHDDEKLLTATHEWTGIMGYSRDRNPWVGAVPESLGGGGDRGGLWICGGYTGHGMPVAALCAQAVVKQVINDGAEEAAEAGDWARLPDEFRITDERLQAAMDKCESVSEMEKKGLARIFTRFLTLTEPAQVGQ